MVFELLSLKELKEKLDDSNIDPDAKSQLVEALSAVYAAKTLADRFDQLTKLYFICEHLSKKSDDELTHSLQAQALNFIKGMSNASDTSEALKAVEQRKKRQAINPDYIPNKYLTDAVPDSRNAYLINVFKKGAKGIASKKIKPMGKAYQHEAETTEVEYLDPVERERYRVFPVGCKLCHFVQTGTGESAKLALNEFSSSGKYIYVINSKGEMFVGEPEIFKFHHSSFTSGGFVLCAGEIKVNNGTIELINNNSGHYKPTLPNLLQAMKFILQNGLMHDKIKVTMVNPESPLLPQIELNVQTFLKQAEKNLQLQSKQLKEDTGELIYKQGKQKIILEKIAIAPKKFFNFFTRPKPIKSYSDAELSKMSYKELSKLNIKLREFASKCQEKVEMLKGTDQILEKARYVDHYQRALYDIQRIEAVQKGQANLVVPKKK